MAAPNRVQYCTHTGLIASGHRRAAGGRCCIWSRPRGGCSGR